MRWALLALTPACTYISQAQYERQLAQLDEDRDGSPHADDCDDEDDRVNPDAVDGPYDGVDQDCDGEDLIDVDRDGFPGISEAAYAALGSELDYPEPLVGKPLDCDDTTSDVYPDPTTAIEVLYDALDADCQRDNDFDFDQDGFMPTTLVIDGIERPTDIVFQEYLDRWGITPAEAAEWAPPGHLLPEIGDCDDRDANVHPENTQADVPYDGVDRDCDHLNDFDADGDCFMPPLAAQQYDQYVAKYYGAEPPPFCVDPTNAFGDCLDEPDPDLQAALDAAGFDPGAVHPSTTDNPNVDVPYDSVDQDCAADNDFDADHDGFLRSNDDVTGMEAYAALWGYEALVVTWDDQNPDAGLALPVVGDCDDTRFDTWPGALDVLGDGIDQDCAGDPDASRFGFGDGDGDFDWTNPTNPEVARLGDLFMVLVGAENGSMPDFEVEFGVAIPFGLSGARGGALPDERTFPYWKVPFETLTMQQQFDIAVDPNPPDEDGDGIPDPRLRTVSNSDSTIIAYTYLNVNGIKLQTNSDLLLPTGGGTGNVPTLYTSNALDLVLDGDGNPIALACAAARLDATYSLALPPLHNSVTPDGGDACFFDAEPVQYGGEWQSSFQLCATGACTQYTLTEQLNFVVQGAAAEGWAYGDKDEDWIALIDPAGGAWVQEVGGTPEPILEGLVVTHLDVDDVGGDVYAAAIVDDGGTQQVWLAYGDLAAGLTETPLAFDDPSVNGESPVSVGIYADDDRVAVAVTATTGQADQDSVGWVFLAPAP